MSDLMKLTEVSSIKAEYKPTVQEVADRVANGTMVFDNISQRGAVWDVSRKSCLIRTILRNGDIPSLNARNEDRGEKKVLSVLEGQQRCRAVAEYLTDSFALQLKDFNCIFVYKGIEMELEGKKFSELPAEFQDKIRNFHFTVNYYNDLSDADANEMFFFSNNGKPIAPEEQMWSVTKSKELIDDIGRNNELFLNLLTDNAKNNYQYRYLIMRCIYMMHYKQGTGLEKAAVMPFFIDYTLSKKEADEIKKVFNKMNTVINMISQNEQLTKTSKGKITQRLRSKCHFVIFFMLFRRAIQDKRTDQEMAEWVIKFFDSKKGATISSKYNMASATSLLKASNVETRLNELTKYYESTFSSQEE